MAKHFSDHYVYVYRDHRNRMQYVGYGRTSGRATFHLVGTHNLGLKDFLKKSDYRIEIAGNNEQTARIVETALISALKPECNVVEGEAQWRFRPLGVPPAYAKRRVLPELSRMGFLTAKGTRRKPVLFVIINEKTFAEDGRVGYDPATYR